MFGWVEKSAQNLSFLTQPSVSLNTSDGRGEELTRSNEVLELVQWGSGTARSDVQYSLRAILRTSHRVALRRKVVYLKYLMHFEAETTSQISTNATLYVCAQHPASTKSIQKANLTERHNL